MSAVAVDACAGGVGPPWKIPFKRKPMSWQKWSLQLPDTIRSAGLMTLLVCRKTGVFTVAVVYSLWLAFPCRSDVRVLSSFNHS